MIKDITLGQYIPGDSFVHKLDPRIKILATVAFITSLFLINKFGQFANQIYLNAKNNS